MTVQQCISWSLYLPLSKRLLDDTVLGLDATITRTITTINTRTAPAEAPPAMMAVLLLFSSSTILGSVSSMALILVFTDYNGKRFH